MRVLVATPCYGGLLTSDYVLSLLDMYTHVIKNQLCDEFQVFLLPHESLISRGRNKCAQYALKNGYDKLLFIDADLRFDPHWVGLLLKSDKDIIGGTYPFKTHPIVVNFNPLPEKGGEILGQHRYMDNYFKFIQEYADENGEVEIRHLPTGFMMIDTSVLVSLAEKGHVKKYETFQPDTLKTDVFYDWFPTRVHEEKYESEDWAFCSIAREAGFKVHLQTQIVCDHVGTHTFSLGQHVIKGHRPLIPLPKKVSSEVKPEESHGN